MKSLTKSEKRSFRLYVNRFPGSVDPKFVQLFDALDRLEEYDESQILDKLPGVQKQHLSNLKRHLYQQLLISLRLIHIRKNIDIQIREQLDFARILYGKGLYMQALKLLDRIKARAVEHHQDILHLEILEFEKTIEARHITRSRTVAHKMDKLLEESAKRSRVTYTASLFSNFNIQVQGYFIEYGHAKSEEEQTRLKRYYLEWSPKQTPEAALTFNERANLFQARMWYHYILLDFPGALKDAKNWVNLFDLNDHIRRKDPDLYVRGMYYLLLFHFLLDRKEDYPRYLRQLENFVEDHRASFNPNSLMTAHMYLTLARLNNHYLQGDYRSGLQLVHEVDWLVRTFGPAMDEHRILLLYYKLAYLHFGCGAFEEAVDFLHQIVLKKSDFLREELHYYAGLLHLFCLVELGQTDRIEYHIRAVKRSYEKVGDLSAYQAELLDFLTSVPALPPGEIRKAAGLLLPRLEDWARDPLFRKELVFLDARTWVESFSGRMTIEKWLASRHDRSSAEEGYPGKPAMDSGHGPSS